MLICGECGSGEIKEDTLILFTHQVNKIYVGLTLSGNYSYATKYEGMNRFGIW